MLKHTAPYVLCHHPCDTPHGRDPMSERQSRAGNAPLTPSCSEMSTPAAACLPFLAGDTHVLSLKVCLQQRPNTNPTAVLAKAQLCRAARIESLFAWAHHLCPNPAAMGNNSGCFSNTGEETQAENLKLSSSRLCRPSCMQHWALEVQLPWSQPQLAAPGTGTLWWCKSSSTPWVHHATDLLPGALLRGGNTLNNKLFAFVASLLHCFQLPAGSGQAKQVVLVNNWHHLSRQSN